MGQCDFRKNGGAGLAKRSTHPQGLLIRGDQSHALVVPPDLNGMAIEVLVGFDQHCVVVLALDDARGTENPAFPIELVQPICNHEAKPPNNSATSHDGSGFVRII
jgi:hypothetical protein